MQSTHIRHESVAEPFRRGAFLPRRWGVQAYNRPGAGASNLRNPIRPRRRDCGKLGLRAEAPATGGQRRPKHHQLNRGDLWRQRGITVNKLVSEVTQGQLRTDHPKFRPGDSVKVHVRVVEGARTRIQIFAGDVIARSGAGIGETFTVRKVSFGVGVERTFPLHSPIIEKIEVARRGDVRRAKLYYLRGRRGKAAKIKEKRDF